MAAAITCAPHSPVQSRGRRSAKPTLCWGYERCPGRSEYYALLSRRFAVPRLPIACAVCGKLCTPGSGSLPEGLLTCRACRRGDAPVGARPVSRLKPCADCSREVRSYTDRPRCRPCRRKNPERRQRRERRIPHHDKARAEFWGVDYEPIERLRVFERDAWMCGICGHGVHKNLKFPDPGYPTLDHVVPISRGGAHTYANVRLAHFRCNTSRANRGGGEQLALVG